MTIHHDKLAYGKLASMKEDAGEDKLKEMAQRLKSADNAQEGEEEQQEENKNNHATEK